MPEAQTKRKVIIADTIAEIEANDKDVMHTFIEIEHC